MELDVLTAISPIDGRYRGKTKALAAYFSEFALIKYRVQVEVEYFITLCELPLPQLKGIDSNVYETLRNIYRNFSEADAQRIKDIESVTNHDVKAVEYFLKEEFEQAGEQQWEALCQEYETDSRTGVKNLTARYRKKQQALVQERERLEVMKTFERKYADYSFICGIDEVGRGPLAGPVVAGAVILPKECEILYINDSKKLSAAKRDELYDEIMDKAVAVGLGMASPARIDEINILQATYEAMREAISKLSVKPDILLNDAVTIPGVSIRQVPIIKGDAKSISIGAASIVAKVTRDRLMVEYDKILPQYGFASNKGYGSAEHIKALQEVGPSPIHRASFIKNFV